MNDDKKQGKSFIWQIVFAIAFVAFSENMLAGVVVLLIAVPLLIGARGNKIVAYLKKNTQNINPPIKDDLSPIVDKFFNLFLPQKSTRLEKRKKYLHIALNSTLEEATEIIGLLPASDRILIEAGTPLIKIYGTEAISTIKQYAPAGTYIVADNKCADLAEREVELMANAGASATTCLGVAPVETINEFVASCEKHGIDSIIDMMNVESALAVLKKLKKLPTVVMLHRGVDETEFSKEKQIPYYQIKQIKGSYNVLVAVAGGDSLKEVQRALFNDADIVVVWKSFYQKTNETAQLAASFLKEVK
ncbi:MAG: orotidine 5'-phosphate decarboxylase [Candidatus Vogelbacteria bacterium]|nr:orotidine 5'-phosphate decarboxylase [Candidatus Vogelbacteria bacterium]